MTANDKPLTEPNDSLDPMDELRIRAEDSVRRQGFDSTDDPATLSHEEVRARLHELRVHQIELEMQNEELRRAQAELDAARARYFDLYDLAPVGYCTTSEQGLIQQANLTLAELLGLHRGALVGRPFSQFILAADQDVYYLRRRQLMEAGDSQSFELRLTPKTNAPFWANLTIRTVQIDGEEPEIRLTVSDVNERRKAADEKAELEAKLQQSQKLEALGVLVAGLAHNINNILAAIMGAASLREKSAAATEDLAAFRTITAACRRGRDVVNSLTQFSKPSLRNQSRFDLNALLVEVANLLASSDNNGVEVVIPPFEESTWVHGDRGSIGDAFMNVCLNSFDAMPNGGTLTIRTRAVANDWAEISFEDSGEGIAPEILSRVTEPFFTTKPTGKGTGLGLSMAHGVVKAHGGTLEVVSQLGVGTTVKIGMPRSSNPVPEEPANTVPLALRSLNILLVDDDDDVLFLVSRMLVAKGHKIKTALDGVEALESLASEEVPDLVILDQNMPRMNGVQTMERIRASFPELPILISSGQPDIQEWVCFQRPNVAVISKPFDMDELLAKLKEFAETPLPQ